MRFDHENNKSYVYQKGHNDECNRKKQGSGMDLTPLQLF